jgi:ribosomal protein S13
MPGAAGADDPALEQALAAQLPARAWQDSWRVRHGGRAAEIAAQAVAGSARPEAVWARAGASGAAAANGGERPKPVAPPLTPEQRKAARLKAVQLAGERKMIRARLQAGEETLAQALARNGEAAMRMRTETLLLALPGIGGAKARRLMAAAGIDGGPRVGGLTAGQRERLVAGVAAVNADLAARHGHRVTIPASPPAGSAGSTRHRKH